MGNAKVGTHYVLEWKFCYSPFCVKFIWDEYSITFESYQLRCDVVTPAISLFGQRITNTRINKPQIIDITIVTLMHSLQDH